MSSKEEMQLLVFVCLVLTRQVLVSLPRKPGPAHCQGLLTPDSSSRGRMGSDHRLLHLGLQRRPNNP